MDFFEDGGFVRVFLNESSCERSWQLVLTPSGGGAPISKMLSCNTHPDLFNDVLLSDGVRAGTYDVAVDGVIAATNVVVGTNNAIADVDMQ